MKHLNLIISFFIILMLGIDATANPHEFKLIPVKNPTQVSVGEDFACALGDDGVICWNSDGPVNTPKFVNPTQVSVGYFHACAIDEGKVVCWGANKSGQLNVPELKNVKQISAGRLHTCAIDENGLKCWGNNFYGQITPPPLKNPYQVSSGEVATCAIDELGLHCWGEKDTYYQGPLPVIIDVPEFKMPTYVSVSLGICVLDDGRVKCFNSSELKESIVPTLLRPKQVVVLNSDSDHACALDAAGIKCWGVALGRKWSSDYIYNELKRPTQIAFGFTMCAIDDDGLKCIE